jgi:hypothetical protein
MFKKILVFLFITFNAYSCPVFKDPIPIADTYIKIDAKTSKTSFEITWKFKELYINSLLAEHDINKNGKFDKNEQEDIKEELIKHLKKNNFITQIIYVKKGEKLKSRLIQKIKPIKEKLTFSDDAIEYFYSFDTDFILQKNHRLFIRFLDPKERVDVSVKDVTLNNYSGKKSIVLKSVRANIYFYDYKPKTHN